MSLGNSYSVTWNNQDPTICLLQSTNAVGPLLLNGTQTNQYDFERRVLFVSGANPTITVKLKGISLGEIREEIVSVSNRTGTSAFSYSNILEVFIVGAINDTMSVSFGNYGYFKPFFIDPGMPKNIAMSLSYVGGTAPAANPVASLLLQRSAGAAPGFSFPIADIQNTLTTVELPYRYFTLFVNNTNTVTLMTLNIYQSLCR